MNRHFAASAGALAAVASVVLLAQPASAAKVKTHVVVELNGSPVSSISMNVGDPDITLTTHMDGNCLSAFEHANNKTFGIAPSDDAPSVATLAPSLGYSGLTCNSADQSWTVHAVANGDATLHWLPVVTDNGNGLQNQMGGASVTVHVGSGGIVNPPGHGRPAAPAVANAHVPHGSAWADKCQAHYSGAKNWHGRLIKDIAHWARDEHLNKTKDSYATDDLWAAFVEAHVDALCNSAPTT